MKKILFSISTLSGGGAERVVSVWSSSLAELGYDVSILLSGHMNKEYDVSDIVKIYSVGGNYVDYVKMSRLEQYKKRRSLIRQIKPDIIISFLPQSQLWTLITTIGVNVKRIETVRVDPFYQYNKSVPLERLLSKYINFRADAIILQTASQGDFFSKRILNKCRIVPNTISNTFLERSKAIYNDKALKFIAVGRLVPQKNYDMMIDAFAIAYEKNSFISLSIYGDDERGYAKLLKEKIHNYHLDGIVNLMGRSECIVDEYLKSDVFLLTSDFEGMPNALMEAMASGLVCISTDCRTGPRDLIDNGKNGYLVDVGDVEALSKQIQSVINLSLSDRKKIGNEARLKIISMCTYAESIKALCEIIDSV